MFVCCYIGVGKAWTELGKVYFEQDFRIKALEAFEQSYRIHKEFYGEQDHPDVSLDQTCYGKMKHFTDSFLST